MKQLIFTLLAAGAMAGVASTALADPRQDLTEVEVSLWEIVAATNYHALHPEATGTILGGSEPDSTAKHEFEKQQDDVAVHLKAFKEAAPADLAEGIGEFEGAYADVLEHANQLVNAASSQEAETAAYNLWQAAHLADDILDDQLKGKLN